MSDITIKHTFRIRTRYSHTDKMGYVYNGNYLSFFEIGRTELMREFGLVYRELEESGYLLPLYDAYVKYHKPAFYDDELDIHSELNWTGSPKFKFDYRIARGNDLIADGYTSHMFVKVDTHIPVKPPKIFLDKITSLKL